MNISIIGGSGFVGTQLIALLRKSANLQIKNIDKQASATFPELTSIANVLDTDALKRELVGADLVILLAAEHRDDVTPTSLYYDVNVQGMRNTLEAMQHNGVSRLIFTSSVAVYGLDKPNPTEDSAKEPFNHYGISKWEAEKVLDAWAKDHEDWNINIIRPTVIFGEGNRGNVFNLLNQIATGKFMMIGKGNNQKSMSYVGNIIAFIQFVLLEKQTGYNIYNYVDKPDFTTNDLVYHTGEILGKEIPTVHIPYWLGMMGGYGFDVLAFITRKKLNISSVRVKKFCAVTKYDSTKAMSSGFVPPYSLEEGLHRMLKAEFGK
ncbi:NAD-dependent epimerase/dehydratase family protein [Sphingobacterium sp. DK4209]|uniref:NAD-dependent epimerase/dehydratase family protein n=1 Tax=Sphingobacterium zhuxiongii TaxID=2662364 RepID=A0A5Q0QB28_9SPHI|nr:MULTISPECIES: NAD-dependent epimerase/dehydratase family protein [unclassified Sphingobacterium]MVZ65279.1 NAD-dependent epimerase/dehydratase family protein [Sphingobacterium sp. DK4209]QGA26369.1 NAD-dependent epimerase/dehydratase family protein [Sphingobacterium sp. dk4302]